MKKDNSIITRELKDYTWKFDKETKILSLYGVYNFNVTNIKMDKVRMASLARFLIRVLYSMSVTRRK